jgi:hypothetical protein
LVIFSAKQYLGSAGVARNIGVYTGSKRKAGSHQLNHSRPGFPHEVTMSTESHIATHSPADIPPQSRSTKTSTGSRIQPSEAISNNCSNHTPGIKASKGSAMCSDLQGVHIAPTHREFRQQSQLHPLASSDATDGGIP